MKGFMSFIKLWRNDEEKGGKISLHFNNFSKITQINKVLFSDFLVSFKKLKSEEKNVNPIRL